MRSLTLFGQSLGESPEARQAVGSQLVQDPGQHLRQLLGLSVAGDGEGVGCEGGLHFGVVEVDDRAVVFDHVHLRRRGHAVRSGAKIIRHKILHRRHIESEEQCRFFWASVLGVKVMRGVT